MTAPTLLLIDPSRSDLWREHIMLQVRIDQVDQLLQVEADRLGLTLDQLLASTELESLEGES